MANRAATGGEQVRQSIRFGRIAGIPIGSHWSVLVIMLLLVWLLALTILPASAPGEPAGLYWLLAVLAAVLFMAALLAHELAHALVARHYGVRVRAITLWLLGGVSELDGRAPHARGDLFIALAGPIVSIAAAGGFAVLAAGASLIGLDPLVVAALVWLAIVNVVLGVFNMLPAAPLDGGRVLAAALWGLGLDRAAAQRVAARAGMVFGAILIAAGLAQVIVLAWLGGLWLALIGWFLITAAGAETAGTRLRETVGDLRVADVMTTPAVAGYAHQTLDDFAARVAGGSPHRSYPVLDIGGRLTGVVTLAQLGRVPPARRPTTRLADVQTPRDRTAVLDPQTSLVDAAPLLLAPGHRLAPVLDREQLVGVVCSGDLTRATELASLGVRPSRQQDSPSATTEGRAE
ncbi:site-2 protease family protein [Natronosporangium hydrolyticum]|uniref:Zinc metalloprotease n=1 Tax=Natronosporangium hydrolyticum TaxID=2811111 RepID=A0A895YH79_9ACTN|nr:site-2 protease family protein [Natronosporangium hydrolyticum]QSB14743.1 site-2 protease family protein [Natronosporangium hydrolyticum]